MTITVNGDLEARIQALAQREGSDPTAIARALLETALDLEAMDREDAIEGIRRGLASSAAGRVRPAKQLIADLRAKLAETTQ
jgi:predicted transcriptional regulator